MFSLPCCSAQTQLLSLVTRFLIQQITSLATSSAVYCGVVRFCSSWWFSPPTSVWLWQLSGGMQWSDHISTKRSLTRSERSFTSPSCGCGHFSSVAHLCSKLRMFPRSHWTAAANGNCSGVNNKCAVLLQSFKSCSKWCSHAWPCCVCSFTWFTRQAGLQSPQLKAKLNCAGKWRGWSAPPASCSLCATRQIKSTTRWQWLEKRDWIANCTMVCLFWYLLTAVWIRSYMGWATRTTATVTSESCSQSVLKSVEE